MQAAEKISVELTRNEALVLFEYLRRCDDAGEYGFVDPAEQRIIWDLEIRLQPQLSEIFDPNYDELLRVARSQIRERCE